MKKSFLRSGFALGGLVLLALLLTGGIASAVGTVTTWGAAQKPVSPGLTSIIGLSSSIDHTLALRSDGVVLGWGANFDGQTAVPGGLNNVTAVAAGDFYSLALTASGTVVAWGSDDYGQCQIPGGLSGVKAISAGHAHNLALKNDGTVVAWGSDLYGQCQVPAGLSGVKKVLAAWNYSIAVKNDGTVVAWGANDLGQTSVPGGLSGVVDVAGNIEYCLALKGDGTVVAWGRPISMPVLNGIKAIAAGEHHALAVNSSGGIVVWGTDQTGEAVVPAGLSNVELVAAGWNYSAALSTDSAPSIAAFGLLGPRQIGGTFSVSLDSQSGVAYTLEAKDAALGGTWNSISSQPGNGGRITLSDSAASGTSRIYRVSAH